MNRKTLVGLVLTLVTFATAAQAQSGTIVTTGLDNPRGLKFGPDGYLYVAEGGRGGGLSTVGSWEQASGPPAGPDPYTGDFTARISKIAPNEAVSTVAGKSSFEPDRSCFWQPGQWCCRRRLRAWHAVRPASGRGMLARPGRHSQWHNPNQF
jgi:hypothetical protein